MLVALVVARVAIRSAAVQGDFRVYHVAARAALAGLDPYAPDVLAAVAGRPLGLPFLYPPIGLVPFLPSAALPFATAATLWVVLDAALLAGLVVLVRRSWLRTTDVLWCAVVVVFGGGASALAALRSGNVALLETTLWLAGLAAFTTGHGRLAAATFVCAAAWKLWPAAFLALFLVPIGARPARPTLAALGGIAVMVIVLAPFVLMTGPALGGILAGGGLPYPVGPSNPAILAVFEAWARTYAPAPMSPTPLTWAGWLAWTIGVVALVAPPVRRAAREGRAGELALLAGLVATLVHPRPMAYGWLGGTVCAFALAAPRVRGPIEATGLGLLFVGPGLASAALHPLVGVPAMLAPPLAALAAVALVARRGPTGT